MIPTLSAWIFDLNTASLSGILGILFAFAATSLVGCDAGTADLTASNIVLPSVDAHATTYLRAYAWPGLGPAGSSKDSFSELDEAVRLKALAGDPSTVDRLLADGTMGLAVLVITPDRIELGGELLVSLNDGRIPEDRLRGQSLVPLYDRLNKVAKLGEPRRLKLALVADARLSADLLRNVVYTTGIFDGDVDLVVQPMKKSNSRTVGEPKSVCVGITRADVATVVDVFAGGDSNPTERADRKVGGREISGAGPGDPKQPRNSANNEEETFWVERGNEASTALELSSDLQRLHCVRGDVYSGASQIFSSTSTDFAHLRREAARCDFDIGAVQLIDGSSVADSAAAASLIFAPKGVVPILSGGSRDSAAGRTQRVGRTSAKADGLNLHWHLDEEVAILPLGLAAICPPPDLPRPAGAAALSGEDGPECDGSILAGGPVSDVSACWQACDCVYEGCTSSKSGAECVAEERQWRTCKNSCCRRASRDVMSTSEDGFCRGGF